MKLLYIISICLLLATTASAQARKDLVRIKADSIHMSNPKGTNELILENRTSQVNGYLYNKGQGLTEFRKMKLKQIGMDSLAIVGQDTVPLPVSKKLYILPDIQCQEWNGAPVVVHTNAFRVYLHLANPETMVDGKELRISDVSNGGWGQMVTIWSENPWLLHEGMEKRALDVPPGTCLRLVYNAQLNYFVVVTQNGPINSTTGPCPDYLNN